ncbi:MAG: hypothetical protein KF819_16100 [Labilithrix sp.]|nr:hypothetical protein [Labilithrix sp.]
MNDEQAGLIENLASLQKLRKIVVLIAIGLIVLSLVQRMPIFVYGRVVLWATAGIVSILEGNTLKKLGQPAGNAWLNAAIYFAVSLVPLLAHR